MNPKLLIVGGALSGTGLLIILFSAAMSGTAHDGPEPRVTVTATKTATETPTAHSSSDDGTVALTRVSVETAWRKVSPASRESICEAWRTDRYTALEAFMEGAGSQGGPSLDSATVQQVLDEKCGTGG